MDKTFFWILAIIAGLFLLDRYDSGTEPMKGGKKKTRKAPRKATTDEALSSHSTRKVPIRGRKETFAQQARRPGGDLPLVRNAPPDAIPNAGAIGAKSTPGMSRTFAPAPANAFNSTRFSTIDPYPTRSMARAGKLEFDCVDYPYEVSGKHGNVCKTHNGFWDDNIAGLQAGRTRHGQPMY